MAERERILLTGAGGQLGRQLLEALGPIGDVVAPTRKELDLEQPDSARDVVRAIRPTIVVNAGAYTAVDRAEGDAERCAVVNAVAPGVLAEESARANALLVHYSTDYVFDGRKRAPYREDDEPAPLNVYGRTKLAGERSIAAAGGAHLILRTSWIYGATGANFLRTMLRLARERDEIRVVNDQRGAPTWSRRLALATASLLRRWREVGPHHGGIYHLSAAGETTWFEFARAIVSANAASSGQLGRSPHVVPITSEEYVTPAPRPAYSVLDNTKVQEAFGMTMPSWQTDLTEVLRAMGLERTA